MKLHFNQVSSTIIDVKKDRRNECFNFGLDNAYPSMIEALINLSVTSKTCVDRVAKAIYGGSFGELGKVVVNSKGQTLNEVLRIAAREYAKHNNCYLQVGYDADLNFKSIVVVPVTFVRIGKADDKGYSGKFLIYDNWDKKKYKRIQSKEFNYIHRFSSNKEVIKKQIESSGGILSYNGQLIHIQKDSAFLYSLSDLHPVIQEPLLEGNSQSFRSRGAAKGFLNTKLLSTQPFKDDATFKNFKEELNDVRGAENSSEVIILEASQQTDDLSKQIKIDDLSSPYNDKLFQYSDTQAEKNITKAWSVPLILVDTSDSGSFGDSGGKLREAKIQLWESREEDRNQLEEVFVMIMKDFKEPIENLEIINPFKEKAEDVKEVTEKTPEQLNAEAKAKFRGSAECVTALIAIQQSVSVGTTTKEAGIAMIVNIFDFEEDAASDMLGDPKTKEPLKTGEND
jgi:hypothetical protein